MVAQAQPAPAELGLREALTQALARDPQVAGARAQVAAANAQSRQAKSGLWPNAGLSINYGRSKDADSARNLDRTTNRSEAFLRWNLFNGLEDRRQIDALRLAQIAAEAELLRALDELCERVGSAYFEVLRQQQLLVHSSGRMEAVEAMVQRVERQAALGKGSDADAPLAAASRIDARLALKAVQSEHRAAAARVAEAQARISTIAPAYLPRLDLDLRRSLYERTAPAVTAVQRRGWSVGVTCEVPLGGAPRARQDEARARAEVAEAELQRVRDAVQAELGSARQQALQADSAAPQLTRQRAHWEAVVRASELQYDAGRRSLMQLIEQHDRRYAVQQRDADNAWQRATLLLRLRRLGGDLAEWFGVAGEAQPAP